MSNKNFKARIGIEVPLIAAEDGTTAMTLDPITGQSPNVLTTGNIVKGAIRNTPTEDGGNIFSFSAAGTGGPTRGLSIDNSIATSQRPGVVLRSYGGGLASGNPVTYLLSETARGSAATPTGLASGNSLGSWIAGGYADTSVGGVDPGWVTDTTGSNVSSIAFVTTEAWTSGTSNLGTQVSIRTNPTGSGNAIQTSMAINPQSTISRSDAFTWQNGKSGTTQTMALDVNGNLTVTGDVQINGNDIKASDGSTAETFTTITGQSPNTTFSGNIIKGVVRDATTLANGDEWSLLNGTGTGYRGVSIDNSALTTKAPATVLRSFTGGAVAAPATTPRIVFERARGTSASPTAIQNADLLGQIVNTGANGAGTWLGDTVAASPASLQFLSAENWASNTNVGTQMSVSLMPTGKTLASVATPTTVIGITPQSTAIRSDSVTWYNGNTVANANTNTKLILDSTGQLTTYGNLTTLGTLTFDNGLAVNAVSELLNTNTDAGTTLAIQSNYRSGSGSSTYSLPQTGWSLGNFRFNSYSDTAGTYALAGSVYSRATENWTSSANGSAIQFGANKVGQNWSTGHMIVLQASPESSFIASDLFNLTNSSGNPLNSGAISYSRTYGEFCYTNAAGFGFAAQNTIYTMPIDTTNFSNNVSTSNTSRINISSIGKFKIIMSLQAAMITNSVGTFKFWLRKNGSDVANSATEVDLLKDQKAVVAMDWMVDCDGSDYWEIAYASASANYANITFPTIAATTSPYVCPLAPAVIFNVIPIGA